MVLARRAPVAVLAALAATWLAAAPGSAGAAEQTPAQTSEVARATLSDTDLVPGQLVRVTGSGWRAGATVLVTLHPGLHRREVTAGPDGAFMLDFDIPPDATTGGHGITVEGPGADGLFAYLQNEVTITAPRPTAALSSTDLAAGGTVTIVGRRWDPSGEVTVTLHPGLHRRTVRPAADGTFTLELDIPAASLTGAHGITVAGVGTDGLYAYLENLVRITAPRPTARLDDTVLRPGQAVHVTGARWEPGRKVTVTLYPGRHRVEVHASDDGAFAAEVVVPADAPPGTYGITVAGVGADGLFAYLENEVRVATGPAVAARSGGTDFQLADREVAEAAAPLDDPGRPGRTQVPVLAVILLLLVLLALLVASGHPAARDSIGRARRRLAR